MGVPLKLLLLISAPLPAISYFFFVLSNHGSCLPGIFRLADMIRQNAITKAVIAIMDNEAALNTKVVAAFDFHVIYILFARGLNRYYFCHKHAPFGW
jgi:hypothetical protein